jgi:hypothetical protein
MNKEEIKRGNEPLQQNLINDLKDADSYSHKAQSQGDEQNINNRLEKAREELSFYKNIPGLTILDWT